MNPAFRLLRNTTSMCPICMERCAASVVETKGEIRLVKTCRQHGTTEVLLSGNAFYYAQLDDFYFSVMTNDRRALIEYEIWPTLRCTMGCSTCCFGAARTALEGREPSCGEIERFIAADKKSFYTLSGGEPTCRDDLPQLIAMLKKNRCAVTINSNGLKFVDGVYLRQLQDAGLDRVNIQFDGFDRRTYRVLRGEDILDTKLAIMNNLKSAGMPTTINAVIAKNVNEEEVSRLLDYAVKNDFINGLTFFTICFVGGARDWPSERFIMPDEIIDILDRQTRGKIARKNVFLFQKLHLAIKAFLGQKYCLYNQIYMVVREKEGYEPIDAYLNLALAEPWIDRYRAWHRRKWVAAGCLMTAVTCLFIRRRALSLIGHFIGMSISYFFKTSRYIKNKRFLSISFSTGCDPYKFDEAVIRHCKTGVITVAEQSGALTCFNGGCAYNLDLERQCRRVAAGGGAKAVKENA